MTKVCICITTYNLEEYVAQALDSVLAQKTNFDFKIIVADDCSSDGTLDILTRYQQEHPGQITVLASDKNMGSLANSNRLFDGLECEYFSFLDGDDYWLGEDHLQRQVDFLDQHPEYMLCAGNTRYLRDGVNAELVVDVKQIGSGRAFTWQDMLGHDMPFFHTSAIMVRNTIFCKGLPHCYRQVVNTFENCALRGEDFRRLLHLEQGPLYAMPDVESVYRIHSRGMWQGSSKVKQHIEGTIGYNFYRKYYGDKYGAYFEKRFKLQYLAMVLFVMRYGASDKERELIKSLISDMARQKGRSINTGSNNIVGLLIKGWKYR